MSNFNKEEESAIFGRIRSYKDKIKNKVKTSAVTAHLEKNKDRYTYGIGGAVLASVVTAGILVAQASQDGKQEINQDLKLYKSDGNTFWNIFVQMKDTTNFSMPVLDTTTGIPYESQNAAAEALGIAQGSISKNVNGKIAGVKGHKFEEIKVQRS